MAFIWQKDARECLWDIYIYMSNNEMFENYTLKHATKWESHNQYMFNCIPLIPSHNGTFIFLACLKIYMTPIVITTLLKSRRISSYLWRPHIQSKKVIWIYWKLYNDISTKASSGRWEQQQVNHRLHETKHQYSKGTGNFIRKGHPITLMKIMIPSWFNVDMVIDQICI